MPDATIHTRATVLECRGPLIYRVELSNGKVILAHLSKPLADAKAAFAPADRVWVELSPYDFDVGRILGAVEGPGSLADAEPAENRP